MNNIKQFSKPRPAKTPESPEEEPHPNNLNGLNGYLIVEIVASATVKHCHSCPELTQESRLDVFQPRHWFERNAAVWSRESLGSARRQN